MSSGLRVLMIAAASLAAGAAEAAVTVLGGGYANACSRAAIVGESERRFEEICSYSLENETLEIRDRAGTYVNRGVMKMRRQEFVEAKRDFDSAMRLRADLAEAYVNRGAALVGLRRYQEGLADLNKALELGVDEPEKAYFNRALAFEGTGDLKAAYFDYLKASELSPEWLAPKQELVRFSVSRR